MKKPIVCFSERLSTFLPTKSLAARIESAKSTASRVGGKPVLFLWDSWHTGPARTVIRGGLSVDMEYYNKTQRDFAPFYLKRLEPLWWTRTRERLQGEIPDDVMDAIDSTDVQEAGEFCFQVYSKLGYFQGLEVMRSSSPGVRERAKTFEDFYVEVPYGGEIVRARYSDRAFILETSPPTEIFKTAFVKGMVTPVKENEFEWMESAVGMGYYLLAEDEKVRESDFPWVSFLRARKVEWPHESAWPSWRTGYVQIKADS